MFQSSNGDAGGTPGYNQYKMTLSPAQIQSLTGGYQRPKDQLSELRKQGFSRVRIGMNGRVVFEIAHYDAVCSGRFALADQATHTAKFPRQDRSANRHEALSVPIYAAQGRIPKFGAVY